ncbi:MAG: hypothetical protein QW331_04165 [Candidatus Woesearchaeota archaeon]
MNIKAFFAGFKIGLKDFGHSISAVVNFFLLLIAYILGIGVVSIFGKTIGRKKFMEVKPTNNETMWKDHKIEKKKLEDYFRTW